MDNEEEFINIYCICDKFESNHELYYYLQEAKKLGCYKIFKELVPEYDLFFNISFLYNDPDEYSFEVIKNEFSGNQRRNM